MGIPQLEGIELLLLITSGALYLLGVQLPTIVNNIPLNNQLQTINVDELDASAAQQARMEFEPRWNRWNNFRTIIACGASVLLMLLLVFLS